MRVRPDRSPRLRLLTGPAGSGKTHRVLEWVREAATTAGPRGRGAASTDDALLVLPTYAQVTRARRVALSRWDARGLFDAPFTTFTGAGERFLPSFRVRALPSADARDRLVEEALRVVGAPVFDEVRDRVGFRERVLRLVKEAKQTGLAADDVAQRFARAAASLSPGPRERCEAFRDVFLAYEDLLRRAGLEDHEDALRRLLDAVQGGALERLPKALAVDGFDDFTAVEEAIVDALAEAVVAAGGEAWVTLPWDDARPDLFEAARTTRLRLLARGFVEERLAGFPRASGGALEAIASRLFGGAAGVPVPPGDDVRAVVAGDPEDEADVVAREVRRAVLEEGVARGWRDVAVVVRSLRDAGPRLEAAFERLGVPVRRAAGGRPLAGEAVVRAMRGPFRVLGAGTDAGAFDPQEIVAWLRWTAHADDDEGLLAAADRAEIRWRERGWPPDWTTLQAAAPLEARRRLELLEKARAKVAAAQGARAVAEALLEVLPHLAPLPVPAGFDDDGRPLDAEHDLRVERAGAAYARLRDVVRGMAEAARRTALGADDRAPDVLADLRDLVERAAFSLPDPRLDAVSLLDAEEARWWEMPVVVVAGLSSGEFPRRPREDPLLDDEAREAIRRAEPDLGLPLAREREARERRLFYGAMTRARRRLVLVRAAHDDDGAPREPSAFLRDLARVVAVAEPAARPLGGVAPALAECFTRRDLALFAASRALRAGDPAGRDVARALLRLGTEAGDPDLVARAARWRRASADALDLDEGDDGALGRFRRSVEVVSASALNDALACRHRHFLGAVLGVPRDEVPFEGPSLDALLRGRLLHEALRTAVAEPKASPEAVASSVLADEPLADAERDLLRFEIARVVSLWRDRDATSSGGFAPLAGGLEWAFDEGDDALRLRGRVDRVDVRGPRAIVMDYKSSREGAREGRDAALEGTDLQLPLYAAAVEQALGKTVVGLEWVAVTRRARFGVYGAGAGEAAAARAEGDRAALDDDRLAAVRAAAVEAARTVVADVRRGAHGKRVYDREVCAACAWRGVCRPASRRVAGGVPVAEDAT